MTILALFLRRMAQLLSGFVLILFAHDVFGLNVKSVWGFIITTVMIFLWIFALRWSDRKLEPE